MVKPVCKRGQLLWAQSFLCPQKEGHAPNWLPTQTSFSRLQSSVSTRSPPLVSIDSKEQGFKNNFPHVIGIIQVETKLYFY